MSNSRYILRYKGRGPIPAEDAERIRDREGVSLVDSTSRMLLVEGPREDLEELVGSSPEWVISEEKIVKRPDPRPEIRKDAEPEKDED